MKKLLAITLALLMLFAACSCSEGNQPVTPSSTESSTEARTPAQETQTQAPVVTDAATEEESTRAPWKPPVITTEEDTEEDIPVIDPDVPPTTLADGTPIELVPISDGVLTLDGTAAQVGWGSAFGTGSTASIFDNGATVKVSEYKGIMVKVKLVTAIGLYMRFHVKLAGAEDKIDIKSNNRTYEWYNGAKWETNSGNPSNWITPNTETSWVFIAFPLEEITADEIADFAIYSSKSENRMGAFSNFCFVKEGNDDPRKLSDGTPIVLERITDGVMTLDGTAEGNAYGTDFVGTTKSIFDDGAKVKVADYKGIMVKVETPAETNYYGLYLHLLAKLSDGTDVDIESNYRNYEWFDGKKWETVTGPEHNWRTPNVESCWVYVPFPLEEITTEEILNFGIFSAMSVNRKGTFSEFSFVRATGEGGTPVDNTPTVPELALPEKLADETAITLVPVSDGILSVTGTSNASGSASVLPYQTTSIFKDAATINPADYKGMLIKVATSTENHAGLYLRFYFKLTDGSEIQVKAQGKSIDFYNGTTWQTYESGETATNWVTPSEPVGYLYLAFPLPEITVSEIADIRIYSSASATRIGTFSDWYLVQEVAAQ